jgi:hypothetical protein
MSHGLLEHFTNIDKPIREQFRVLKPGGIFFADIVTSRFSVDTLSKLPSMVRQFGGVIAHRRFSELNKIGKPAFFENNYSLQYYIEVIRQSGGEIKFAMGDRPYTSFDHFPALSPVMLKFYKSPLSQRIWEKFDKSNSIFSRVWGAGWLVLAKKV